MKQNNSHYPTFDAYQAALQHPGRCFALANLKNGNIEKDLWGFPRVRSGGFALTYQLSTEDTSYAVRCFHKDSPKRAFRYQKISAYLEKANIAFFVPINYMTRGVKVGAQWYPITVMPWIDGNTLEAYVYKNLTNPEKLKSLPDKFAYLMNTLAEKRIAHGDLSHQNIMVKDDQLYLVDYDGLFIPALEKNPGAEIGHSNFQHPLRVVDHFDEKLDYFSSIVIFLALSALAITPQLWAKYEAAGDGLLFRKKDFINPYQSELIQELETYTSLRKWVGLFKKICVCEYDLIPSLEQFISQNVDKLPRDEEYTHLSQTIQQEVAIDATQRYLLLQKLGKVVRVVGKVQEVFEGKTRDGHPHIFLNVGNWRTKCFTVVLWGEAYEELVRKGVSSKELYEGKWISVRGVLTSFRRRLQIALDTPIGVEVLKGEGEAKIRLGMDTLPEYEDLQTAKSDIRVAVRKIQPDLEGISKYQQQVQSQIDRLYKDK